tara:strand:- start:171 stop:401 length:231 start_codon:yes stop_codon:yes gene_type:complete
VNKGKYIEDIVQKIGVENLKDNKTYIKDIIERVDDCEIRLRAIFDKDYDYSKIKSKTLLDVLNDLSSIKSGLYCLD